jgi:outer membrane protein TolC
MGLRFRLALGVLAALAVPEWAAAQPVPAETEPAEPVAAPDESTGPRTHSEPLQPAPPASRVTAPTASRTQALPAVRTSRTYGLKECLALANKNYPKIHESRAKVRRMEAQLFEARTAPFSNFELTGGLALAPHLGGTAVYSPNSDVSLTSDLSLAWRVGIEGVVPLWTFGKITSLIEAAEAQIKVGEQGVEKEKNELALSVRRAYYGIQLARDALALIGDAEKRIDKYLGNLQQKVDDGEGDDIELLKLKMYRAELTARESEARKQERVALAGLKFLTGIGSTLDIPDRPLEKVTHALGPLARYLRAARLHRPEINMARAGILARRAQMELEQARYLPDLGLGLSAKWTRAPQIADQVNPFVRDEGNYLRYGAGLVLHWKLDFLPQSARVAQAEAQLEELRATERFALGGVGVEVETAFEEAREAKARLDAYGAATQFAKRWLIKVQQGIDVGTMDDEDIVDPAKEYALKRFSQMSATFDYNVAFAKLAQVTGWQAVAPP